MVLLIISFSTFAVGSIARPLGGLIFGHFGDRVGRKRTLVVALMMMGAATTLIGLLPTYAAIGVAAPLILVLLRFVQGLAIGGQWAARCFWSPRVHQLISEDGTGLMRKREHPSALSWPISPLLGSVAR